MILQKIVANDTKSAMTKGSRKIEAVPKIFWERGRTTEQAEVFAILAKTEQVEFVLTTQGGVMVSTGIGKYEERAAAGTA